MIRFIKNVARYFIKQTYRKFELFINKRGGKRQCYVCKNTFNQFLKNYHSSLYETIFWKKLEIIGSDLNNFQCVYCGANDRERHLFMFFDKINLWEKIKRSKILHFAPEKHLRNYIENLKPTEYILADLFPNENKIIKIDATNIPFIDSTFEFIICNHVLEHIPDYKKAISEIYRVLKPNGIAILQTPYSGSLKRNFEDENISNSELRLNLYGQEDHVRIYSGEQLISDIKEVGFKPNILKSMDYFNAIDSFYYGINPDEDLLMFIK